MSVRRYPNGFRGHKERNVQGASLNAGQQEALLEFFWDMAPIIYEELIPLAARIEKLPRLPEDINKEQTRVLRNLRKSWEYIADNFNTIGIPEDELQGPAVAKEAV
jgi:hypothetical protein